MSTKFDFDVADKDASEQSSIQFPIIFWKHGDKKAKAEGDTVNHLGGLFFTYDAAGEGAVIEDKKQSWQEAEFESSDGKTTVKGIAACGAVITIIRTRRRWFFEKDGRTIFQQKYEDGFRAVMHAVGFVRGYEDPVCFSFKGMVVSYIESIRKEHAKLVAIMNKTAPDKDHVLPPYALWTAIKAGPHEQVGQGNKKSWVTYPQIVLPDSLNIEAAQQRYVGRDLLLQSQTLFRELDGWASEWEKDSTLDKSKPTEKNKEPETDDEVEKGGRVSDDDIPF